MHFLQHVYDSFRPQGRAKVSEDNRKSEHIAAKMFGFQPMSVKEYAREGNVWLIFRKLRKNKDLNNLKEYKGEF